MAAKKKTSKVETEVLATTDAEPMPVPIPVRMPVSGPRNTTHLKPLSAALKQYQWKCPPGTHPTDLLQPEYWKHLASILRREDILYVKCLDGTWGATYEVVHVGLNHALLRIQNPGADGVDWVEQNVDISRMAETHKVEYSQPRGYHVVRLSDNEVMKDGFATAALAHTWLVHEYGNIAA